MAGCITLDAQHPLASARHVVKRRAPHCAQAADDDIEVAHAPRTPSISSTVAIVVARLLPRKPEGRIESGEQPMAIRRDKVAILADMATVKTLLALLVLAALGGSVLCGPAAAEGVPLPRPRPGQVSPAETAPEGTAEEAAPPSACRLRLTAELAVAPSLPPLIGPGECNVDDVVRLEAVWLVDKARVPVTPPAILRCSFAEAVVHWVREDVAPAVRSLGGALRSIDNFAAYDCRGRNRIIGARLSEHGRANALDIRSLKLVSGTVIELTDPHVAKDLRERLRKNACARFTTVLGPGSDGYHENHVHLDLAERRGGHRMCQWDVREPGEEAVPLPPPRPADAP
jgi:hypothetical protein